MAVDYVWPDRKNRERPKATYELNVYVVPEHPSRLAPGGVERALEWLERERIIGCFYDEGLGWIAPGERSELLFADVRSGGVAFEYLIPYSGSRSHFVPNAHTGRFGATCAACGADLDEALHGFLQQGTGDAATHELTCGCGVPTKVSGLSCAIDTAVTPAYLNFCHVNSGELRESARRAIKTCFGGSLRVVRERL